MSKRRANRKINTKKEREFKQMERYFNAMSSRGYCKDEIWQLLSLYGGLYGAEDVL